MADSQTNERNENLSFPSESREERSHTPQLAAARSRQGRLRVQGSALGYDTSHYFLSIDDTDNESSPGTGHVLEAIGKVLESKGLGKPSRISRHQLFVHPDIPYTSHNSAMCMVLKDVADQASLISVTEEELVRRAAEGSDPGICCAGLFDVVDTNTLLSWGMRAKMEVLTMEEAYRTAGSCGLYLNELGGSGDGIIGALAGVALRLGGSDGRFRGRIPVSIDFGDKNCTAEALLAIPEVDACCCADTRAPVPDSDPVLSPSEIKTVLLNGKSVLPLRRSGDIWRCLTREETKEMFA